MDQELIDAFADLGRKIDALGSRLGGATAPGGVEVPPGFVAVRPTGAQGAGKVRFWPTPLRTEGQAPRDGEMLWAYADRCSKIPDPKDSGRTCWPQGKWPDVPGFDPYKTVAGLAEMLDRSLYSRDWMDQEELIRQAAMDARDAAEGNRFSPY